MDVNQELIYINKNNQWLDKTKEISSIIPNEDIFIITFKSSPKSYTYRKENIHWLSNPTKIDSQNVQIWHRGIQVSNYIEILYFKNDNHAYYRIFFHDGSSKIYDASNVYVVNNSLINSENKSCFSYLKRIASVVGLVKDGINLLEQQYEKITFIRDDSVLSHYLNPKPLPPSSSKIPSLLFPFGCNHSQIEAIHRAFENQISVIEGPPGTGKTQTILNIIANMILQKKTVAIVSNNNEATKNIQEKLQKYGLDFFIASLGNQENKDTFLKEQTGSYPNLSSFQIPTEALEIIKARAINESKKLREMLQLQNKLAKLKEELSLLQLEKQHFEQFFPSILETPHRKKVNAETLASVRAKYQVLAETGHSITLFHWLYTWIWQGIGNRAFFRQEPSTIYASLSKLYYILRTKDINQEISTLENTLDQYSFTEQLTALTEDSLAVFKAFLFNKYGNKQNRQIFIKKDLCQESNNTFSTEYPIILSTTHSILSSVKDGFYDYVIIDESSQVDLVTGALALSCAQNTVIVGDQKQLPNVVNSNTAKITDEIFQKTSLPKGYRYSTNSLLSSILLLYPEVSKTLLQEHYRCHPKIIRFCNQRFYNGQLIAMTKDNDEKDILGVCKTVQGNHARGHYNQRQIDEIKQEFLPDLLTRVDPNAIGIISPYRAQKNAIKSDKQLNTFMIDTVHKFQGREKDAVIITTVDNEITPFTDNPNMLNVAVSRAKKYLRVLISDNEKNETTNFGDLVRYIEYNGGTILQGEVRSVFDLLYKGYEVELQKQLSHQMTPLEFNSEKLIFLLLQQILTRDEFSQFGFTIHQPLHVLLKDINILNEEEQNFIKTALAHTDFLIFNKMNKSPVLVIEVDGYNTHVDNEAQMHRDTLKDQILTKYSIDFIRLRTNESNEEARILDKLNSISATGFKHVV